ncbi:nucleolar protein 12-like [Asterias rubens]|uniref:nucleolar protein 12-like n=1 Tax=Asterias rubens TaxID=7604 RepID=UPI00145518B5|nr:nucleolar protein 12-like [Asterias rubens]
MSSNKFRQKNPKNKKTKFHLIFDDENRREFLTGFQKRKKERKRVALEQQELKYKEEKQRVRQENRKAKLASWKDLNFPDEKVVEEDKEPIVYDHPEHTVTVESVGGVTVEQMDLHAAHGGIGENQVEYDDDDDDDDDGVQSRLKGLARYDDDSSDEEEDAVQDAPGGDKNSHPKKKSVNLQKLKSKLVKGKSGRKGSFVKQNGVSKKVVKGPRGHLGGRGGKGGKKGGGRGSGRGRKRNF